MEDKGHKEVIKGGGQPEENVSFFKKIRGTMCHYCPLCRHAREYPESTIGKILHHPYHADHCPFWKAEKEVYGQKPESEKRT